MSCQPRFLVWTPQFETSGATYYEPAEYGACAVEIITDSPTSAKSLSLQTKEFRDWIDDCRDNECNPFTGLKVERMDCPQGYCCCVDCKNYCPECVENRQS